MTKLDNPDKNGKNEANIALIALYAGVDIRAADVPESARPHLFKVITVQTTPPRNPAVQARMDALSAELFGDTP